MQQDGTKLLITPEGRLDTATAPEFRDEVMPHMEGITDVVIDFAKVDYVSSAGLRVLLSAHKQMSQKGGMKVTHLNEIVQEVFNVTGFSDILTIE